MLVSRHTSALCWVGGGADILPDRGPPQLPDGAISFYNTSKPGNISWCGTGSVIHLWTRAPESPPPSRPPSTYLVSGQLSDLDDLHSELHEQRLQDQALVLPVLLAHGLLPLGHAGLEDAHRGCSWCTAILLSLRHNSAKGPELPAGGRKSTFGLEAGRAAFKDAETPLASSSHHILWLN